MLSLDKHFVNPGFMNYLFMSCFGLTQEKVFLNNYGVAALSVFKAFGTLDNIVAMDIERLVTFIAEKG